MKLPNGLIIQWGSLDNAIHYSGYLYKITYPIPFPHKIFSFINTPSSTIGYAFHLSGTVQGLDNYTNTYALVYKPNGPTFWLAIGY